MDFLEKYNINNKDLYNEALTHSSYRNEHNLPYDYERLEFLGDAILEFIITEYLYDNFNQKEGVMTKLRASYVCENALNEYAKSIKLYDYVRVGTGELRSSGNHKKVILADVFEAIIAALFLDKGMDTAKEFVYDIVIPFIENNSEFFTDYKTELQEKVQCFQKTVTYELIDERGPGHDKEFTTNVLIDSIIFGTGCASTKKESEQRAAKDALLKYQS